MAVVLGGGVCISHVKIGNFTKAYLGFNEKEQEISLIREKEKSHRNNISVCFNRKAGNVFWDSVQNACPVKEVRDGVSRFAGLSNFPKTSTVSKCKYWLITTRSNYIS